MEDLFFIGRQKVYGKFVRKKDNLNLWKLERSGWIVRCSTCGQEVRYKTKKEAIGVLTNNFQKRSGYCGTWCFSDSIII